MANFSSFQILFFLFITSCFVVSATTEITFKNNCSYNLWPVALSGNGHTIGRGGWFTLGYGSSVGLTLNVPPGWRGRFWARTGCNFNSSYKGNCVTGNCRGGRAKCTGGGVPPFNVAEFTLNGDGGKDFYSVSLVDGYNVKIGIQPQGGSGDCKYIGCVTDLNKDCPRELRVIDKGKVVARKSACTGAHSKPGTCSQSTYSKTFKRACPTAYSYAYENSTSTFTCTGANYLITFCP